MRSAALNKVIGQVPAIDIDSVEEVQTIMRGCVTDHNIILHLISEHVTSVSGDENHFPIAPGTMIDDMVRLLSDE